MLVGVRRNNQLLGIKVAKTTAYHLQVDGHTEWVNHELEQYLWLFTSERTGQIFCLWWSSSTITTSTPQPSKPHFFSIAANICRRASNRSNRLGWRQWMSSWTRWRWHLRKQRQPLTSLKTTWPGTIIRSDFWHQYTSHDKVYLDVSDISTTWPSWKLSHLRLDPYPIERQVSQNAYTAGWQTPCVAFTQCSTWWNLLLHQPTQLWAITWNFRPHQNSWKEKRNTWWKRFLIARCSAVGYVSSSSRRGVEYKTWEGYGVEHKIWEYTTDVHAPKRLAEFYRKHPAAPRQIRGAIFSSISFQSVFCLLFHFHQAVHLPTFSSSSAVLLIEKLSKDQLTPTDRGTTFTMPNNFCPTILWLVTCWLLTAVHLLQTPSTVLLASVWKSGLVTGKRLGLDRTKTD